MFTHAAVPSPTSRFAIRARARLSGNVDITTAGLTVSDKWRG